MSQIPGYYYDEEKKKYFKIEKSSSAPSSASWSAEAVKRRKVEHRANELARQRDLELSRHIKRHELRDHAIASETLKWETRDDQIWKGGENLKAAAWAGGLEAKKQVRFEHQERRTGHLPCLWVGGQEQGLEAAVAYSSLDESTPLGSYVPVDGDGKISFEPDAQLDSGRRPGIRPEGIRCPQMSSLSYHQGSHQIILSSRQPDSLFEICLFSPPLSLGTEGVWTLEEATCIQRFCFSSDRFTHGRARIVNNCKPAPACFPHLICAAATDRGVSVVGTSKTLNYNPSHYPGRADVDILDLDFHQTNPNIILAAGRQPFVWLQDQRARMEDPCPSIKHESSIARVRSVSENQVLVCGLENTMTMYDIRYFPTSTSSQTKSIPRPHPGPMLTFPEYRNSAHLQIGFDVSLELNIAAAAQDDGTVKLFSLSTGRRLACPALDGRGKMSSPIKALTFQTIPGENSPSLFVGEGSWARKYSFGSLGLDM